MPETEVKNAVHQDMIWRSRIVTEHKNKARFNTKNGIEYHPPAETEVVDQRVSMIKPMRYQYQPNILTDINLDNIEEGLFRPDQYLKGKNGLK